jgi:hypothetical protein
VKEQLRDQGVRVSLVPIREITERAQQYLAEHPELFDQARERALRLGMIAPPMVTPDADLPVNQITQSRALKRLNFLVQLLRFSVPRAY